MDHDCDEEYCLMRNYLSYHYLHALFELSRLFHSCRCCFTIAVGYIRSAFQLCLHRFYTFQFPIIRLFPCKTYGDTPFASSLAREEHLQHFLSLCAFQRVEGYYYSPFQLE